MKKIVILLISVSFFSCKKETTQVSICKQCVMVVTDSITGDTLEIQTGSPTSKSMYRCDGALRIAEESPINYQHFEKYLPSLTQGFKEYCY